MGLIRKTLAVGTVGVVKGSSKKQRVAKATMKSSAATAKAADAMARAAALEAERAELQAKHEHDFRYATDPVYKKYMDDKLAAEQAAIRVRAAQAAEATRLKRERNRARRAKMGQAIRSVVVACVVVVVAVLVWAPQYVIAKIRHQPVQRWMKDSLRLSGAPNHALPERVSPTHR